MRYMAAMLTRSCVRWWSMRAHRVYYNMLVLHKYERAKCRPRALFIGLSHDAWSGAIISQFRSNIFPTALISAWSKTCDLGSSHREREMNNWRVHAARWLGESRALAHSASAETRARCGKMVLIDFITSALRKYAMNLKWFSACAR